MISKEKEEGDRCDDLRCNGILYFPEPEDCSCHINAPCHWHETVCLTCISCGKEYHAKEEGTD